MKKEKKVIFLMFTSLISVVSLPLFVSCSTSENQETNSNNKEMNDDQQNNNNKDERKEEEEEFVSDIVNKVNTRYCVNTHSNKLFFTGVILNINPQSSNYAAETVEEIKKTLFPNGYWTSKNIHNEKIYETKNFNNEILFKNFLNIGTLKNENINDGTQTILDFSDINCNGIANSKNIKGFFKIC